MADFTDLVLYLSSGNVFVWIGSGASTELGLPTWRGLANRVLEECRRKKNRRFPRIEALYRQGQYLEQFDEVVLGYGEDFLYSICAGQLRDPGAQGAIYKTLCDLPFAGYLNYELRRYPCSTLGASGQCCPSLRKLSG